MDNEELKKKINDPESDVLNKKYNSGIKFRKTKKFVGNSTSKYYHKSTGKQSTAIKEDILTSTLLFSELKKRNLTFLSWFFIWLINFAWFISFFGYNVSNTADESLHVRDMEELVRSMSIWLRTQYACNYKLPFWPDIPQHSKERNGHAFAEGKLWFAVISLWSLSNCFLETFRILWGIEPACAHDIFEGYFRIVRRIFGKNSGEMFLSFFVVLCGWDPQRNFDLCERKHNITSWSWFRQPRATNNSHLSLPSSHNNGGQHILMRSVDSLKHGEIFYRLLTHLTNKLMHFLISHRRNINLECVINFSSARILKPIQQLPDNPERRGYNTRSITTMDSLGKDIDAKGT